MFFVLRKHDSALFGPPCFTVVAKYTLVSFLPKGIFEQFRRIANVYFLGKNWFERRSLEAKPA